MVQEFIRNLSNEKIPQTKHKHTLPFTFLLFVFDEEGTRGEEFIEGRKLALLNFDSIILSNKNALFMKIQILQSFALIQILF